MLLMAQIMAADAISSHFEPEQSFGDILHQFLPVVLNISPYEGYSNFSAEECHEWIHGDNTCSKVLSRDNACISTTFLK